MGRRLTLDASQQLTASLSYPIQTARGDFENMSHLTSYAKEAYMSIMIKKQGVLN